MADQLNRLFLLHSRRPAWHNQQQSIVTPPSAKIKSWLFDQGSLTTRLIGHCDGQFSVKVLSVTCATPSLDEMEALKLRPRSRAIIRQVALLCNDRTLVCARTIIPISSLRGALRGIVLLGNQSLGAILFADKRMYRESVEVARVKTQQKYSVWMQPRLGQKEVWGRRSIFILKKHKLLVSEYFSADVFETNQMQLHERVQK